VIAETSLPSRRSEACHRGSGSTEGPLRSWSPGVWSIVPLVLLGCEPASPPVLPEHVEIRDTLGDTIEVRTVSGSVWGGAPLLIEELRIGRLDGPEEETFGSISDLAVDADGGIYVFDRLVPALRYFNEAGDFVRTLGREGSGPGEYRSEVMGLAVRRDGRVILRDHRNARFNLYNPDGSVSESWFYGSGRMGMRMMFADQNDHTYLKIGVGPREPGRIQEDGYAHFDETGEVIDTLRTPSFPDPPPRTVGSTFAPSLVWAIDPQGDVVIGANDRYVFEVRRRDGRVVRVVRELPLLPLLPKERAEHEARRDWTIEHESQFYPVLPPPVPEYKPFFREFFFGDDGTIWVHRFVEAEKRPAPRGATSPGGRPPLTWREPTVFDVFERDGTYLGEVRVPSRTTLMAFSWETVWALQQGQFDETSVVRFRLGHE